VFVRHLVLVIPHARQSSTQNNKYQVTVSPDDEHIVAQNM